MATEIERRLIVNIDKLQVGKTFKNYKVMCEELGIKPLGGNSKKRQMSEINRYCLLRKSGYSLTVVEVFETPAPELSGRGSKPIYGDLLQLLFTDYFISLNTNNVTLTRNTMLKNMRMINSNYQYGSRNIPHVSSHTQIDPAIVDDFFNTTRDSFKYMIDSTLDALRSRALIMYNKVTMICKDDNVHRIAEPHEKENILYHENLALKELGYDEIGQVIASNNWDKFQRIVQSGLREHRIKFYYSSYDIIINKEHIEGDHNKMLEEVLDKFQREEKKDELNSIICERLEGNAIRRKNNTKLESSLYQTRNIFTYESDNKKLVTLLVDHKTKENLTRERKY